MNRPTEVQKEKVRQILWISDSEGEDNSVQNKDDELIRYLIGKENVEISKPKSKTKPKLKTILKKIVKEKHKRAGRIECRKQKRPNKIKVEAIIHRLTKSPEKFRSPRSVPINPGAEPPCPN